MTDSLPDRNERDAYDELRADVLKLLASSLRAIPKPKIRALLAKHPARTKQGE